MTVHRILIVDGNAAFATMLQEGLEASGAYQAVIASSGIQALDIILQNQIDLAIVDMDLEDMDGQSLVQSLRQSKPGLRIMLIPLFGQDLEDTALLAEVQGILPKPFFIGDLPNLVRQAIAGPADEIPEAAAPIIAAAEPKAEPAPMPRRPAGQVYVSNDIDTLLSDLFKEIRAVAVLFIRGTELIAHAGNVTRQRAQEMAELTKESLDAAHRIAAFLGESDNHFEQCTFEGNEFNVYSTNVTPDTTLSVALSSQTPVGIVRYNLRRAAEALSDAWYG